MFLPNPLVPQGFPFVTHNKMNQDRICMPTIVSYPNSHAYKKQASGKLGEGRLWNILTKCWEEPTLEEKEQLMGYAMGETCGGHDTVKQRASRLGQAMDGNTMRWLGAFLYAQQHRVDSQVVDQIGINIGIGFKKFHNRISNYFKKDIAPYLDNDDNHDDHLQAMCNQACAILETILEDEPLDPNKSLGGGDIQNPKRQRKNVHEEATLPQNVTKETTPGNTPDRDKPIFVANKWKIGGGLKERD